MKKTKGQLIKDQIEKLYVKLWKLQAKCKHKNATKHHWKAEGYATSPIYYTDFECPDCLKHWMENGSL